MTPVRFLRITLPLALVSLILSVVFRKSPPSALPVVDPKADRSLEAEMAPVGSATAVAASVVPPVISTPPEPAYQPGFFPGVSTRHVPGPDPRAANDPPAGVPQEITLPSGEKVILTLTDERHSIPLKVPNGR